MGAGKRVKETIMVHRITLIPGDGTGPELTAATRRAIDATGVAIDWEVRHAGADVLDKTGTPLPEETLESIRRNRIALKGPITTPVGTGFRSVNVALRHALGLYACVRPCKIYPGVKTRYRTDEVDIVIVRENTEDLYAGIEFQEGKPETLKLIEQLEGMQPRKIATDSGISIKPISITGSERIVRYAFAYARRYGRRRVTAVHKANIMKFTDGLFLQIARQVARDYPDIAFDDRIVDNMCMQLVQRPEQYDVLVLPNLYGDIISDLGAGLIGGLGVAPGANIGDHGAVYEPTHGSAPKYKGLNKANPTAMMLSGVLMLRDIGEEAAADVLETAIADVIRAGRYVTYDLKPRPDDPTAVGTKEYADAVIHRIEELQAMKLPTAV
jgi:isocitrate dehydrogenase (NAD+)